MTTRSHPSRRPSSAYSRTRSGASRPPAWVTSRSVGRSRLGEAGPVEQVERVGHPRERGRPGRPEQLPEALVDDGGLGEDQPRAPGEVAVEDREPVAVVQRQRGRRAVVGGEPEVRRDGLGVAAQVVVREPDQLGGPGRPGRAEQQGEIGVQVVGAAGAALDRLPLVAVAAEHDVGVVGLDQLTTLRLAAVGHEQRHVPVLHRGEVGGDRLGPVGALDEDQATGAAEHVAWRGPGPGGRARRS